MAFPSPNPFPSLHRRACVVGAAALALSAAVPLAQAQQRGYPSHIITLVHPYAAGGSADALARGLAQQLEQRLKISVIVEAKAGGAATIGTGFVARAKPDGYTLALSTSAGHVVTPLMQKIPYDGVEDFAFIAVVANQPNVLVVNPSLGIDNVQTLIAQAKKDPSKFNFASAGAGGATHLGAEAVWQRAGLKMTHVPYAGAAPALKDLVGGQVQVAMLNVSATLPLIEAGRIKALAYGAAQRSPLLPNVPTLAEVGFAGAEVSTWYTLAAPKGTPPEVIETLRRAVAEANADPAYQKLLAGQGAERMELSPAETTAFVRRDKENMSKLLETLNLLSR
ncbi:Bug family tripartite tricarboxylate transporter substrate binding protein [Hydrogenophaga sp. BPS33]|uniref:Bug family tripartite tricarboxylate transporter substrate binding protein n=1 Tax=Hydrogenophaga sp. BPS33 TaxID=2651974 RepID=UPI00131FDF32|nr:tripartite tricarboxylate transporter substrate binding protein [Hydrogenophaga sp. BPS33]QHE85067.1 tripartite tricarboxylate transporter substrate binding protein [Hydrogenophaga sp. BPS33]